MRNTQLPPAAPAAALLLAARRVAASQQPACVYDGCMAVQVSGAESGGPAGDTANGIYLAMQTDCSSSSYLSTDNMARWLGWKSTTPRTWAGGHQKDWVLLWYWRTIPHTSTNWPVNGWNIIRQHFPDAVRNQYYFAGTGHPTEGWATNAMRPANWKGPAPTVRCCGPNWEVYGCDGDMHWWAALPAPASELESAPLWPISDSPRCPEVCCCKACSDPDHDSFPYGPLKGGGPHPEPENPPNPELVGDKGQCEIPTWERNQAGLDLSQYLGTVPPTIWWRQPLVFRDDGAGSAHPGVGSYHVAPPSCDCCRWSGIDNSCVYAAPPATRPAGFRVAPQVVYNDVTEHGATWAGGPTALLFVDGVELSAGDAAELRNSTSCGYLEPPPLLHGRVNTTNGLEAGDETAWHIDALPDPGCYRVCYFHSGLTTPTWYDLGTLDVLPPQEDPTYFHFAEDQVVLEGLDVVMRFANESGYSIFDDVAEIRTDASCGTGTLGDGTLIRRSAVDDFGSRLSAQAGYAWCQPAVERRVSDGRPRRYLATEWAWCPIEHRLRVPAVEWAVTLPAASNTLATYTVCYKKHDVEVTLGAEPASSEWHNLGLLVVRPQLPAAAALGALYAAAGGPKWHHAHNWGDAAVGHCEWYGVICDASGSVHTIALARNNLFGTIPREFTEGNFSSVVVLNLEANELWGTLPQSIGHWTSLRSLDLGFNSIQGTIPESLTRCPLRSLYLSDNILEGALPYSLRSLVVLRSVWADGARYLAPVEVPQPVEYLDPPPPPSRCPADETFCPVTGATTPGVTECGFDGVTEVMCVQVLSCCWNPDLTSGKPCFTRKRVTYDTHPGCNSEWCEPVPPAAEE